MPREILAFTDSVFYYPSIFSRRIRERGSRTLHKCCRQLSRRGRSFECCSGCCSCTGRKCPFDLVWLGLSRRKPPQVGDSITFGGLVAVFRDKK